MTSTAETADAGCPFESVSTSLVNLEHRQLVIAKLITACYDLEDALKISVLKAPGDSVIIPSALRNELAVMRDDLAHIIAKLEDRSLL